MVVLHTLINTGSAGGKRLRTRSVHTADGALCEVYKPSHRDEPLFLQGTQHCALLTQISGLCTCSVSVSVTNNLWRSSKATQRVVVEATVGWWSTGVRGWRGGGYACHTRVLKRYTCASCKSRVHFSIYLQRTAFLRESEREREMRQYTRV